MAQEAFPNIPSAETPPGSSPEDQEAMTRRIVENAILHPLGDPGPDATDRWLEEVGGGPRRETLAADPPYIPHRAATRRRRRSGSGPQFGEEEGVGSKDGLPAYYQPLKVLSDDQVASNTDHIAAMRAIRDERDLAAAGDNVHERARIRARQERERRQRDSTA